MNWDQETPVLTQKLEVNSCHIYRSVEPPRCFAAAAAVVVVVAGGGGGGGVLPNNYQSLH